MNRLTTLMLVAASFALAAPAAAQTIHNNPSQNIYDSTDPLCSGSDPSITFCDGFEDGTWIEDGSSYTVPSNDGWAGYAFSNDVYAQYPDPSGRHYAECRTRDGLAAPHGGAGGTNCAATASWVDNNTSGINGDMQTKLNGKLRHLYMRFYVKFKGATSQICPGGPPCPDYRLNGPNGIKLIDWLVQMGSGGIIWGDIGTPFANDWDDFIFGANCQFPQTVFVPQNQGNNFSQIAHNDNWVYFEVHAEMNSSAGVPDGKLEFFIDDCGPDGTACPATPTLRLRRTDIPWTPSGGCRGASWPAQGFDVMHFNGWNSSNRGEMQWDEIVVRDGDVLDRLIGPLGSALPDLGPPPTAPAPARIIE